MSWLQSRILARSYARIVNLNRLSFVQASSVQPRRSLSTAEGTSAPTSAQVVIIGGGSIGCSMLYHLAKMGMRNVVLLEKDALTAGTTWHTAGLVWHLRPSDTDIVMLTYGWDLMKSLEAETGVSTGYIQNGGLFIANNEKRLLEYKQMQTLGKWFGIESSILSPAETKQLYPLMNVSDMAGALYSPTDGTIDPAGYCSALSRASAKMGGKTVLGCRVTGIETAEDEFGVRRIRKVRTNKGDIVTSCIVNASGVWAPSIGKLAGVSVPQVAMRHAYIVTERIEGIQNMPNTRDHDASVYLRLQGDALSVGGYEPNPIFIDEMPSDFAFSLYELDWDVFAFEIGGAVNRVPAIGQVGVKSTVCGPESFTPDGRPLLGEDPDLRGFYHASAYNSGGMMYSGGTARELARWIITGRPELDMFAFDVKRFRPGLAANSQWLRERSHETYAKHYSVHYHHDEPLAGRSLTRRSPLHSRLAAAGCVYQERHGFERPGWFHDRPAETADYRYYGYYGHTPHSDYEYERCLTMDYTFSAPEQEAALRRECRTCRSAGAVFDMSYFGKLMLTGPGSAEAVDYLFSADIRKPVGSTVYTCLLNERGGVEADLTVSVLEPGAQYYLAIGGAAALYVKHYLLKVMQDRGWLADNRCQLEDRSDDMTLISVQGPVSRQLLAGLVDGGEGFLSDSAFPFGQCRKAKVAGRPALMLRVSFVGELGWELHLANADAPAVYDAVMAAGKPLGVVNAGYRALDSLSCEKGYRHGHVDLRSDDTPLEAGLAFTCKLKLPDRPFIGREALERQRADGLRKRMICLTLDDAEPGKRLHGNELVLRDGQPVGFVRRAEQVYCLAGGDGDGVTMAYAYASRPDGEVVKPAWLKAGAYQVECMGERRPAKLHLRSPFDPENLRLQGRY
uniref:Sarcosine dehydrogenase, mitochondrial n=2 Tax=Macrostomum lignano TaxID=282301 RepID=A0A1I8H6P6_9PLAT